MPAPCDVSSMVSSSVSIILLKPKSVILTSPLTDPLPTRRMLPTASKAGGGMKCKRFGKYELTMFCVTSRFCLGSS